MINLVEQPTEEKYLTIEQVMERLQISRDTVTRLIARKQLKAKKIGRMWRISERWLQAYMEDETEE